MADDWLLWQLADSAFPSGSFAHSGGLEAAWQAGLLAPAGGAALADLLRTALTQAARGSAPFAAFACRRPDRFDEADAACDAFLSNHVANRASRAQGQAMLTAADRIFHLDGLSQFARERRRSKAHFHLAPVFGVVAAALGLDESRATRLFMFLTLRGLVSAAVRLGIVGPLEAQSVQNELSPDAERLSESAEGVSPDDVTQTAPLLDLIQGAHDRLYSRLFQS